MSERVKIGFFMPYVSAKDSIELGVRAEKLGYDSVWFGDHVTSVHRLVTPEDQFTLLSIVASRTKRVELGTAVTDCHRRPPIILAQMATTIDVISGGRLILGVGAGEGVNLSAYGIEWKKRPVSKLLEFIKVMKKLWSGETIDFDGEFFKYRQAHLPNRPVQKPHPPIWVGGWGPRMRRITGELADGWIPLATPESYKEGLREVLRRAEEVGRRRGDIYPGLYMTICVAEDFETAVERYLSELKVGSRGWPESLTPEIRGELLEEASEIPDEELLKDRIVGSPDDCIAKIEEFKKVGARHFALDPEGWTDPKETFEEQRIIAEKIIPYFKGKYI